MIMKQTEETYQIERECAHTNQFHNKVIKIQFKSAVSKQDSIFQRCIADVFQLTYVVLHIHFLLVAICSTYLAKLVSFQTSFSLAHRTGQYSRHNSNMPDQRHCKGTPRIMYISKTERIPCPFTVVYAIDSHGIHSIHTYPMSLVQQ